MTQETLSKQVLRPLGNRVLAKRSEAKETLKGGIILPDSAKKKQETAVVIAIGPGSLTPDGKILPMPIKIGDTILMDKYAGQEVSINDEDYIIVRLDDIVAIINA